MIKMCEIEILEKYFDKHNRKTIKLKHKKTQTIITINRNYIHIKTVEPYKQLIHAENNIFIKL